MTISPGDLATQVYNEAMRGGASHQEAAQAAWKALQVVKNQSSCENDGDFSEKKRGS